MDENLQKVGLKAFYNVFSGLFVVCEWVSILLESPNKRLSSVATVFASP